MKRKWTWALLLAAWTACQGGNGNPAVPDVPDTDRDEASVDLREVPLDGGQEDEASQPADEGSDPVLEEAGTDAPGDLARDLPLEEGPPLPCPPSRWPSGNFAPFGDLGDPMIQIHPAVAFDGEAVWWAFNLPAGDGSGNLSPWAARMACDGSFLVPPFRVEAEGYNAVDPAIAVSGDSVLVAWQTDVPEEAPANMSVRVRAFLQDGTPRTDGPLRLVPRSGGEPVAATLWMPNLAPTTSGFLLSATLADPNRGKFQTILSRLGFDGRVLDAGEGQVGDWWMPAPDEGASQTYGTALEQDGLWVTWVRSPEEASDQVQVVHGPVFGGPLDGPPAWFPDSSTPGSAPVLASRGGDQALVVLGASVGTSDVAIRIRQVHPAPPSPRDLVLDAPGRQDVAPALALGPTGGMAAWFRIRSGYLADVRTQAFRTDPEGLTPEAEERLINETEDGEPHDAIAAYPLAVTPVGPGAFLVAWVERRKVPGQDARYQATARFVETSSTMESAAAEGLIGGLREP
ncbi:MAG TPA: hypothetical protein PLQ97_02725 [Myxococcota bacterium]|nr:hypothetical protein [Myxococcota bacterium]HQK50744.1 hypothetical protein [Myxococcota bacterium]